MVGKCSLKFYIQKNTTKDINYTVDYLISLGTTCFYCDTKCSFGNKEYTPDALTFDRKDSKLGYYKENIIVI